MTFARRFVCAALISLPAMAAGYAEESPQRPATEKPKDSLITPKEVIERLEASKTKYFVASVGDLRDVTPEKFGDVLWPEGKSVSLPKISKSEDGRITLTAYDVSDEALKLLHDGDTLYAAKKYEEALAQYRELVGRFPDFYKGWLYLGDALFMGDRYPEALAAYSKGVDLNPYDYQGHLFKGHALVKLGRNEEALSEWVRTLSLRPHQPTAVKLIMQYRGALNVEVDDSRFEPAAMVRREDKGIMIYTPTDASWISWADCKALWLGEPSYRRERTGKEEYQWTSTEEWECLANLYAMRSVEIQDKKAKPDRVLDRLTRIGDNQMLSQMMMYDVVSRVSPDFMLLMPEKDREGIEDYIGRYVVVRKSPTPH